jgi:four helix bundle protein
MSSFERLEVWQRAVALSADLYRTLQSLRDYGFKDQITRAGLSIASNIAEGMERDSRLESLHYLAVARSSCAEMRTQAHVGIDIGYIDRDKGQHWIKEGREISAMLMGLSRRIRN